jgi:selenocysteine lyase/cysteine desulfurase
MTDTEPKDPGPVFSRREFLALSGSAALSGMTPPCGATIGAPETGPGGRLAGSNPIPDEAFWEQLRSRFLVDPGLTYMNNGSLGPMPLAVVEANARATRELATNPIDYHREEAREDVRARLAAFVGAQVDEIAITRSTTEGMNTFAQGIDWNPGDEVLMCTHEHTGGYGPYKALEARRAIRIKWIELPTPPRDADEILDTYRRAMSAKTRVLVASHITFVTGLLMPVRELAELAHARGALLSVDGAHPLGMLSLDLEGLGCDHYAASGQKWLLGGTGTGLCHVRGDLQSTLWPLFGFADADQADTGRRGARKYEMSGQQNLPSIAGLGAALRFQEQVGQANIEARVRQLGTQLREGLAAIPAVRLWTPRGPGLSAGLTSFTVGQVPMHNVARAVRERTGIYLLPMPAGDLNAVRASTHFYNTPAEVEKLLAAVRHIAENEFDFV